MNRIRDCRYGTMIYNDKDQWVGLSLERYGEFSEGEVQLFREVIKPGSTVLDIGANIGCHTVVFSKLVAPGGVVLAFEPERVNFNTLAGNLAINNLLNVYVFQQAVGASPGLIAVPELDHELTDNVGGLSLCTDYSSVQNYSVHRITLDQLRLPRVDFIKIDIEGMEKSALEGSRETISRCKPLLYVEDDRPDKSDALFETLKSMDYVLYKHAPPLFNPHKFDQVAENFFLKRKEDGYINYVSFNLFCHHKSITCPVDTEPFGMTLVP